MTATLSDTPYRTPAWILLGMTGSLPGVLEFAGGRLAWTGEEERVFDAPLDAVSDISFPWYYFGGGMKLTIAGERYRLSFVRPNDGTGIPAHLLAGTDAGAPFALLTAGRKVRDIGEGRAAGKAWKALLTGKS